MKIIIFACLFLPFPAFSQLVGPPPFGYGEPAAFSYESVKILQEQGLIGAVVKGKLEGGHGFSDAGRALVGDTGVGVGGDFTTWSGGTGLRASAPYGGTALKVQGDAVFTEGSHIEKPRARGNLLKLYDPDTGELLLVAEFEITSE